MENNSYESFKKDLMKIGKYEELLNRLFFKIYFFADVSISPSKSYQAYLFYEPGELYDNYKISYELYCILKELKNLVEENRQ